MPESIILSRRRVLIWRWRDLDQRISATRSIRWIPGHDQSVERRRYLAYAGFESRGDTFSVSFDGKLLFTVTDRTFTSAGKVALWTKADSVTRFGAFSSRTLP